MAARNKTEKSPLPGLPLTGSRAARSIALIEKYCILPETRELMVLHDYQKELIEEWAADDTRAHFTKIPAGNAKSTTLAAFTVAHLFLENEAFVPVVAKTVKQALLTTYGIASRMCELHEELDRRTDILTGQQTARIRVGPTHAEATAIADKPGGLQGLKPSLMVLEEASEASVATYGAMQNRLGKRPGSRLIAISTPSFLPENALLFAERLILTEEAPTGYRLKQWTVDDLRCDIKDESIWRIANPALCTDPPILDIESVRLDTGLPEQMFRAYRLAQWPTGDVSCWLNSQDQESDEEVGDGYDVWMRCESDYNLTPGAATWAGVDVALSGDHAAVVYGQHTDRGKFHVRCKVFTPDLSGAIDLDEIGGFLHQLAGRYDLQSIHIDPNYFFNAPQLAADGLPIVAINQQNSSMAPRTFHAYKAIRSQRLSHEGGDQFTQHVMAGKKRYGPHGFQIEKITYQIKADAAIALVLCYCAATEFREQVEEPTFWMSSLKVNL